MIKKIAPMGMAVLLKRCSPYGRNSYYAVMDRLNCRALSSCDIEKMDRGELVYRTFEYENYKQEIPFAWD